MNGSQYPPRAPERPIEGGRDAFATQSRAVRRLESRAAGERRRAGEVTVPVMPSLTPRSPVAATPIDGRSGLFASGLRSTLDVVLRRLGRTRHR